jgi:Bacterial regulatory helix-turn-helix protein, lysR family
VTADLGQMRYFVAVAEHGNFTHAADELRVAQQAVSEQITALEATLGVTLLRRSSRKVERMPSAPCSSPTRSRCLPPRTAPRDGCKRPPRRGRNPHPPHGGHCICDHPARFELLIDYAGANPGSKSPRTRFTARTSSIFCWQAKCDLALMAMGSAPQLRQRLIRRAVLRLRSALTTRLRGPVRRSSRR